MDYDKLIDKHFGVLMNYKAASIENYIKTGTVSGTFRGALKDMLKEACECETSDNSSNCNIHSVSVTVCNCLQPRFNPITDRCLVCNKPYKIEQTER